MGGDEAADAWAKTGALDRNEAWSNAVHKLLTSNLGKAREAVRWLAQGVRPDGKLPRQIQSRVRKADVNRAVLPDKHVWLW